MSDGFERRLAEVQDAIGPATVAVSGGVDSLTLAVAMHRRAPEETGVFHALSPAVPAEATARVRALADQEGWALRIADAGEFRDRDYLANPVNRCFFCKSNLYAAMRQLTDGALLSGTNLDDLGDFRPGLQAAKDAGVRHPYVEAGIDKAGVRRLARTLGLADVAELPAQPCLSSRIETGLAVEAETLALVHRVETALSDYLGGPATPSRTVRCRVRRDGLVVELDADSLAFVRGSAAFQAELAAILRQAGKPGDLRLEPYRRGSAFLQDGKQVSAP